MPHTNPPLAPHNPVASIDDALDMDLRFIALDVETANGHAHSICQIGLACMRTDGQIATLGFFVNPEGAFEQFNTRLHGIDARTVTHAPMFPDILERLRPLLERSPLVQHSGFDKRAMNSASDRYGLPPLSSIWHDSVTIARRAWPQLKGDGGHGLGNLKAYLSLDFEHHDAVEDARAAAQVVLCAEVETGHRFDLLAGSPPRKRATTPRPAAQQINPEGALYGLIVSVTGKLSVSRTVITKLAAQAGVTLTNHVDPGVAFLVIADADLDERTAHNKSAKRRKVEELVAKGCDIRILHEAEFRTLIQDAERRLG